MATISLTDPVAATTVTAGLHAGNNAALRTAINGGLDTTNLAAGAAVKGSQLATGLTGPPGTQIDYVEVTTNQTSVAVTSATATAVITSSAVAYDGATAVWIEFYCGDVTHSVIGKASIFSLYDSATELGIIGRTAVPDAAGIAVNLKRKLTPSSASHTYSIRAWTTSAGTVQAGAAAGTIGVDVPMFLRITKA